MSGKPETVASWKRKIDRLLGRIRECSLAECSRPFFAVKTFQKYCSEKCRQKPYEMSEPRREQKRKRSKERYARITGKKS